MTTKFFLPFFLLASSALAQPFSLGVKVGLPLTDFVNTVQGTSSTVTNRYLVGPTAELHLPWGFGAEFDALYRHFNYRDIIGSGSNAVTTIDSSGAWEFPLLLKYRFPAKVIRPFVDGGVAWDHISAVGSQKNTTIGGVVGAGLDVHILLVHILPEIRYTRWTDKHFNVSNVINSNQNQAEFMVGITF